MIRAPYISTVKMNSSNGCLQDDLLLYRSLLLMNEWSRAVLQPASEKKKHLSWQTLFVLGILEGTSL